MRKRRIKWGNVAILLAILFIFVWVIYRALWVFNIIPHKKFDNDNFGFSTYKSQLDKDGDGIDDQTDILENVRRYVATKPVYMSKYYSTGYPDDKYGVCTDVVAQGLLGAGYDLMELVDEDRHNNPDGYANEVIDKKIDFRRVRNLLVYFSHTAIELTTDIYDCEEWQGGDIVVFEGHIGVVSDKRNKDGIAFVIHNGAKWQESYEQDILELRKDEIVGHFRIS